MVPTMNAKTYSKTTVRAPARTLGLVVLATACGTGTPPSTVPPEALPDIHHVDVDPRVVTGPNEARASDLYGAEFFHDRWSIPTVPVSDVRDLCVVFRVNINAHLIIWHVRQDPIRTSGSDIFDDSARRMLEKLVDDRTVLPEPPIEVAESFKGRAVDLMLTGAIHGDASRCRPFP